MNCGESFDKVKVTEKSSKYLFKIGNHSFPIPKGYKITESSDLCDERCIIFYDIGHMYRFQEKSGITRFTPYYYNCDCCDYHTNQKGNFNKHMESNRCRAKRGLDPLDNLKKSRYNKYKESKDVYYCKACDYSPKLKSSKASMKAHIKTKKHNNNCCKMAIVIDTCMSPIC